MLTKQLAKESEKRSFLTENALSSSEIHKDTIVTLRNIRKEYPHPHFTLNIDRLDFSRNKIHVIVGPNGSGKSTLLKIVALFEKPNRGSIFFNGSDVFSDDRIKDWYQKQTGFIAQTPYLFTMDVSENVSLGLKLRKHSSREIVARVANILKILEIQHLSKRRIKDLSRGEYQKVAIAQILVLEPKIILMDEPMSNIDAKSILTIEEVLKNIQKKVHSTIIMTTHSFNQAYRLSSEIISISDGRIIDFVHENVFSGEICELPGGLQSMKVSEDVEIVFSTTGKGKCYIAIDPENVILSKNITETSARNHLLGTVTKIELLGPHVRVLVDVGVHMYSVITRQSFQEMNINLGSHVILNFKVNSVKVI